MSSLPELLSTPSVEVASHSERKVLKNNDESTSVLFGVKLEVLTVGRMRLPRLRIPMPVMATGEGKIRDSRVCLFIPIYLEGNSASSAYWGGLEELLGNVRDFLEEVRLCQWPMPFFRQVTQQTYLMPVGDLLKWMHAYLEELKRLRVWRLRHLDISAKAMRVAFDQIRDQK